jgi:hypothetical protein
MATLRSDLQRIAQRAMRERGLLPEFTAAEMAEAQALDQLTVAEAVPGASAKGTWGRLLRPPVEGRVVRGGEGLDVGERVRVRLEHTDAERGFIDLSCQR